LLKVVVGCFRYTTCFGSLFGAPKPLEFDRPRFDFRRTAMAKKKAKKKGKKKGSKKR
jgi:hypothetical protein